MTSEASARKLSFAGGAAGVIEGIVVQPLEIVKVRFQLNNQNNGSIHTAVRSLVQEGGVGRLYRGLLPELAGMFPTRSAMYASNELFKRELITLTGQDNSLVAGAAGFLAGTPEAIATTPFQVVKIRLQSAQNLGRYNNTIDCMVKVMREEGPLAFTTGLPTTAIRNSVWNSVYFFTMFHINAASSKPDSHALALVHSAATGFAAGVTATGFNNPLDVIKSRIQSQAPAAAGAEGGSAAAAPEYTGTFQAMRKVVAEEGPAALYKGFGPKALRMGLGGGVAVATFEAICKFL